MRRKGPWIHDIRQRNGCPTDAVRCANVPRSVEGNTMDLVLLKYWVAWLSAPHGTTWHDMARHGTTWHDMAHSWWKVVAL